MQKDYTNFTKIAKSRLIVVYFDQLSGAARTRNLVETLFFSRFQPFLFISRHFQFFLFIFRHFLLISAVKLLKKV